MKKITLLLLIVFVYTFSVSAQTTGKVPTRVYKVWADTGSGLKQAYLASVVDSIMYTSASPVAFNPAVTNTASYTAISYAVLKEVRVAKKGKALESLLIGAAGGAAFGAIIGYSSGDDKDNCFICFTAGEKAEGLGLIFGTTGAIVGTIVGLSKKRFIINYDKENFSRFSSYMLTGKIAEPSPAAN